MQETETAELDQSAALTEDLLRLRGFLEGSDVEGARAWIKELEKRWPDSEQVRHYVRVLAPPVARVVPGEPNRSFHLERTWLREHGREYPGCWLAVLGDRLIVADSDLGVVLAELRKQPGASDALVHLQPGTLQKTTMLEAETAEIASETTLAEDLLRLRGFLERSDIEGARAFVKELEQRWPDSEKVRHFARVLAPPQVFVRKGEHGRPLHRERAWLREHGREYPGHWLAVFGDQLVAADRDLAVVLAHVRKTPGAEEALVHFQPGVPD